MSSEQKNFSRFAWGVLGYHLLVILWGAWVRITGSGAGCGSHWPSCNGEVIPRSPSTETLIEFTHRATSGLSMILGLWLLIRAFREYPRGHRVRAGAVGSFGFLVSEALLGAGLVVLGLVDTDSSWLRALFIVLHLVNTFALTGFTALTAWWAGGGRSFSLRNREAIWLMVGLLGVLLTSMAGAITALGDTLFQVDPNDARGLLERLGQDIAHGNHFLVRLRIVHPAVAVVASLYLWFLCGRWREREDASPEVLRWTNAVGTLVFLQMAAGFINIWLAAPGWMQILHLLLASLLWLALLLMTASALEK